LPRKVLVLGAHASIADEVIFLVSFSDTASGKTLAGRPELAAALDALDRGDELVIAEWDRATRSMWAACRSSRP
jgi:DNA invertase Pin-like site-specific DNA recombinase